MSPHVIASAAALGRFPRASLHAGLLEQWASESGNPSLGVSVGVLHGNDVEVVVHGLANAATGLPVTPDTVFQIGSNTKLWTATLAMVLVEEGLIGLEDPVVRHVPEFQLAHADASTVTIRHLLTHTGGFLGDHFGGPDTDSIATYVRELAELPQLHPVGEMWSYCNSGWVLLGRVIEKVTGLSYPEALRTKFLDPIGDTHTRIRFEEIIPLRAAVGHELDPHTQELTVTPYGIMPPCAPAGSIPVSSAADVLRFARLHLDEGRAQGGTQVLQPSTVAMMQTKQLDIPEGLGRTYGMGLGWLLRRLADGQLVVGHGGATPSGQFSMLEVVPDRRLAVVVLTNGPGGIEVASKVVEHVLTELAGATLKPAPVALPEPALDLDYAAYVGEYGDGNVTFTVHVDEAHRGLRLTVTQPQADGRAMQPARATSLSAVTSQIFAQPAPDGDKVMQFLGVDSAGRPGYLFAGRLYPRRVA